MKNYRVVAVGQLTPTKPFITAVKTTFGKEATYYIVSDDYTEYDFLTLNELLGFKKGKIQHISYFKYNVGIKNQVLIFDNMNCDIDSLENGNISINDEVISCSKLSLSELQGDYKSIDELTEQDKIDLSKFKQSVKDRILSKEEKAQETKDDLNVSNQVIVEAVVDTSDSFVNTFENNLDYINAMSKRESIEDKRESNIVNQVNTDLRGLPNCPVCGGKGIYISDLGIPTICSCVQELENRIEKAKQRSEKYKPYVSLIESEAAVDDGLIPPNKKDIIFNRDLLTEYKNLLLNKLGIATDANSFKNYADTLDKLLFNLASGNLPTISYFISAPNGFGKSTFAFDCIKKMKAHNMRCVPYLSLSELAEKKLKFKDKFIGSTSISEDKYRWEDFIKADIIFTYISAPVDAEIEFYTLCELLSLRSAKSKPTIVFSERPVTSYMRNKEIRTSFIYNYYSSSLSLASLSRMYEVALRCGYIKSK